VAAAQGEAHHTRQAGGIKETGGDGPDDDRQPPAEHVSPQGPLADTVSEVSAVFLFFLTRPTSRPVHAKKTSNTYSPTPTSHLDKRVHTT